MSDKRFLEKTREEMGLMGKILSYIPGYHGYKEKELRRESDRLVRMQAANMLKAAKSLLRRRLANPYALEKISGEDSWRINTLMTRLDRATQRIEKAIAGYAGIFDAVKVKEDKLDKILEYDLQLIERSEELKKNIEKLVSMRFGEEEWRSLLEKLIGSIEELDSLIDSRSEILRGLIE